MVYKKRAICLNIIEQTIAILIILFLVAFVKIKADSFATPNAEVLAFQHRFGQIVLLVFYFLIISMWTKFTEFLSSGKKEKDFWKTETWMKDHNEKKTFTDYIYDYIGPFGIIIAVAICVLILFFSRNELTKTEVCHYNFLNIKTFHCPVENISKAQIGIEEHSSRHGPNYNTYIKIYIGDKVYKMDTFKNYNIQMFYEDFLPQLGTERLTVKGRKYTESYLGYRSKWTEERKESFRQFMENTGN